MLGFATCSNNRPSPEIHESVQIDSSGRSTYIRIVIQTWSKTIPPYIDDC